MAAAVHESSFQRYETVDVSGAVEALSALTRKRRMESTPYPGYALKVLEFTKSAPASSNLACAFP